MFDIELQPIEYPQKRYNTTFAEIINTLQWIIIALILAFTFRAFVMEAFRIPTGSMAETLRGAHYHLRCARCGYEYDVGGDSFSMPTPRCPSCTYYMPPGTPISISNGDRILVLKCIYQFADPKRWDVVVFKNPLDPQESYIKRMIAGPGETVEIIDGDIYIDGQIARKPPAVQKALWMPIYDNDYQPFTDALALKDNSTNRRNHRNRPWQQPFKNDRNSNWNLSAKGPAVFALDSEPDSIHTIYYDSAAANDFRATYAYNNSADYHRRPVCSDLMVQFQVIPGQKKGLIGAALAKYGIFYAAYVNFDGEMIIEKIYNNETTPLQSRKIKPLDVDKTVQFRFANVDHQLIFEVGTEKLQHDLGSALQDAGPANSSHEPRLKIFGAGKPNLWHIAISRDIHYISSAAVRAGPGKPFKLGPDEFFVCGDNSPNSFDARAWATHGIGNNGQKYRTGVVPRDYLMGKAFFLYWSNAFRPYETMLPIIPNIDQIRFIAGGSDKQL